MELRTLQEPKRGVTGIGGVAVVNLSAFMSTGSRFKYRDGVKALEMQTSMDLGRTVHMSGLQDNIAVCGCSTLPRSSISKRT